MNEKLLKILQSFDPTNVDNQFSKDFLTVDPNRGIEGLPVHTPYKDKWKSDDVFIKNDPFTENVLFKDIFNKQPTQQMAPSTKQPAPQSEQDIPVAGAPMRSVSSPIKQQPEMIKSEQQQTQSLSSQDLLSKLISSDDPEMKEALKRRADQQRQLMLARASEKIMSGMLGIDSDKDYLKGYMDLAEQDVQDIERTRKAGREKAMFDINMTKAVNEMADEDARRSPNSEVSKLGRGAVIDMLNKIGRSDMAQQLSNSNLSIKQLEDVYGQMNIQNYISMYEAQQSRAAAAAMQKEVRSADKKERLNNQLTTHLADKIKEADKNTGYNKAVTDYQMLRERLASGKFDSVTDLTATYSLMKALDPSSVVRESEFDNLVKTQGGLQKILRAPERFFKGDIYSNDFRKKLVDQFGSVVDARKKQFDRVVSPYLKRAEDLGIEKEYLLALPVSDELTSKPETGPFDPIKAAAELQKRRDQIMRGDQ